MDVDVAGEHPVPSRNPTVQELSQEAESLVYQLNHPTPAVKNNIPAIQERLQQIQRLPQGWDVARYLLDHPDSGTKFFGALSFIVKINQSWTDLSDDGIKLLKSYLVSCYVTLIETKERRLVTRKLESAIVAAFLHDSSWSRPLLDLAAFFWRHGQESSSGKDLTGTILPSLTEVQISGLLSFALTLAEDSIRSSDLTRKDSGNHPTTESIEDAFSICHYVLGELLNQARTESEVNEKTGYEVLESCRAWLNLRNSIYFKERNDSPIIQNTVERMLLCMEIESLSDQATMVVADMLTNGDTELKERHLLFILNYLQGSHGKELVQMLVDGDYDDRAMAFWALLEAYTARKRVEIITESLEPSHAVLATYLDVLFQAPGYPGVEDVISPRLLEWWTETADSLLDGVEQGLENAHQHVAKAVLNVYNRLQLPPDEEFDLWTPDERSEFHNFRRDTKDFLLSMYATLGMELFGLFRQKAVAALEVEDWKELEAACFCLAQLSEAADDKQAAYDHLNAIFTSETFTQVCYNSKQISVKTRQTLVDMLGLYETFFEHNPGHLPKVLTFLFSSLNIEACTKNASRSIQFLCKSCRKALTGELPVFLRICNEFQQSQAMTTQSLERVLEGIAAVVQALPTEEAKAPIVEELLRPFLAQSVSARDDAIRGDIESAHSRGQMAVKCVAGIGRGLRTDESKVIDLEKEDSATNDNNTFWYGHPLQEQLCQCIFLYLDSFPLEHEIIEGICDILKAGFTETIGLYVFRPAVTARILTAIPLRAAAASDTVMSTASSFLASHQGNPQLIREEAISLFMHVYWAFSFMMDNPENHDPEVSNSGISFLTRSLPKYHEILFSLTSPPATPDDFAVPPNVDLQSPVLQRILNFVSLALSGREPLPLRSAAQFWVGVLTLPNATNSASNVSRAIQEYLPGLCHVLMTQLSGGCARSDIHYFCDVLRKIIFNFQGEARKRLAAALALVNSSKNQASPPSATLLKDSDRFLAMLLSARGGTATLEIVRAHWVNCRGAAFSYLV